MENLNAEQAINELETQTKYAKFIESKGVLLSAKCAQFALDNIKDYEQRIKELTEENERLSKQVADLQDELKCEKETNEHLCGEYMSAKADTQKTKMSHGRRQIEKDMKQLIDYGFVELLESGKNVRKKNTYMLSNKWRGIK